MIGSWWLNIWDIYKRQYSNWIIHHTRVTTSSGKTTGNGLDDYSHKIRGKGSDGYGSKTSLYREYEQRLQDEKRSIKLLNLDLSNDICTRV